jgi:hypothetical protein
MNMGRSSMGDIVPAMYPIPANPVMAAWYSEQAARAAASKGGLGLFVPAQFAIPENPVRRAMTNNTSNALGYGGSFEGPKQLTRPRKNAVVSANTRAKAAGVTSSGQVGGVNGLSAIDLSSFSNALTSIESGISFGVSNLLLVGGGLLLLVMMGGSHAAKGRR